MLSGHGREVGEAALADQQRRTDRSVDSLYLAFDGNVRLDIVSSFLAYLFFLER